MAKKKTEDNFTSSLIKSLNKEHGSRVAYNLSTDESPTHVNRWIGTGSKQLDYIIANRQDGGLPEGRHRLHTRLEQKRQRHRGTSERAFSRTG